MGDERDAPITSSNQSNGLSSKRFSAAVVSRMVSTRDAIRALRTVMPKCARSGRELTDLIAAGAVRRRLDVNFDGIADKSGPLQNESRYNHAPQWHP